VSFFKSVRFYVIVAVVLVAALIFQQFWHWEVERVEVPAGKFLVRVHRWGKNLPEGDLVAPDESYKGVMLEVLGEGRQFLNPIFWGYEVHDMVYVPPDQCLVLIRKYGKQPEHGDILADEDERGIVRDVLREGSYRINPYAYDKQLIPAVKIGDHQVGVHTLKVGKDPRTLPRDDRRGRYAVPDGYRGVQQTTKRPGTYYLNPYVETITPVEVRSHRVEFTDIEFPSRDGFILRPHVLVEYAVQPDMAPEVLVRLADEGLLHQEDRTPEEQQRNEILQKVILPYIRGFARIEGSNFNAKDFIVSTVAKADDKTINNREALQRALLAKVQPRCLELGIEVKSVNLADMVPPADLVKQISEREIARVELDKNKILLTTYKAEQERKAIEALKQQAADKVAAETRLKQAQIAADQGKEVELSRLKNELAIAQVRLETAREQAKKILTDGEAEAKVIQLQNEAEVAGLRKAVQGFTSAQNFAQYHVLLKLAPVLTEIFASDDSEFARIFATYMTAPVATPSTPTTTGPAAPAASTSGTPPGQ
jgi:hypothetical protein